MKAVAYKIARLLADAGISNSIVSDLFYEEEVKVVLEDYVDRYDEGDSRNDLIPALQALGVDSFTVEEHFGGEDCGSNYWAVIKTVIDGESHFIRLNGWYASHYGCEFEGAEVVEPHTVEKIEWKRT